MVWRLGDRLAVDCCFTEAELPGPRRLGLIVLILVRAADSRSQATIRTKRKQERQNFEIHDASMKKGPLIQFECGDFAAVALVSVARFAGLFFFTPHQLTRARRQVAALHTDRSPTYYSLNANDLGSRIFIFARSVVKDVLP
jgi:hypothetical protein